jgi:hypothetical protein
MSCPTPMNGIANGPNLRTVLGVFQLRMLEPAAHGGVRAVHVGVVSPRVREAAESVTPIHPSQDGSAAEDHDAHDEGACDLSAEVGPSPQHEEEDDAEDEPLPAGIPVASDAFHVHGLPLRRAPKPRRSGIFGSGPNLF